MDRRRLTIIALVAVMLAIKLADLLLAPNHQFPGRPAAFPWIEIGLVLVLGLIGMKLSEVTGLPDAWDKQLSEKSRVYIPFAFGVLMGLVLVIIDSVFRIGDISVGWPLSPYFYIWGAISQEVISHLFPVTFFTWIFSNLLLKKRHGKAVYWVGATLLSLAGAVGMASAFANPDIPLTARYVFVPQVIGILVFGVEMAILGVLRRLGFIAALSTRLGFYSVWHVIWPLIFY